MRKRSYEGGIFLTRIEATSSYPIGDEGEHEDEGELVAVMPRCDLRFKRSWW